MYDTSIMMESQLPPIYIKKEHKKTKVDQGKMLVLALIGLLKHYPVKKLANMCLNKTTQARWR